MAEKFQAGVDPRELFKQHRERGPGQIVLTRDQIAEYAGIKSSTMKQLRLLRDLDLDGIVRFLMPRILRRSGALSDEDFAWAYLDNDAEKLAHWRARHPRIVAWSCPLCADQLPMDPSFERGLCKEHGAKPQAFKLGQPHIMVLCGGLVYRPYHRLILDPQGRHVHHVDFNPWNNRPENLLSVTAEEHRAIHAARLNG